ncbi:MAG: acetyl-CoA carboxylase biotin carboxyl carrier protein [Myxococcales bacterium]|nr:acetyl-CoA carboxylase biotin carboxyl carrier protein [Myxococcales bacterium]
MAQKKGSDKARSARSLALDGDEQTTTLDVEALRQIVEILEASEVTRLAWRRGDERLFIRRGQMSTTIVQATPGGAQVTAIPPPVEHPAAPAPKAAEPPPAAAAPAPEKKGHLITSPFVGTFYRAPAPDQPPFVEVGTVVKKGQVLCIVEAMKLMNEIESEVPGRVAESLVETGHPVEFGQPLFRIEPA